MAVVAVTPVAAPVTAPHGGGGSVVNVASMPTFPLPAVAWMRKW